MTDLIDQLYCIAYNPLVTPACLINNIKLPEYQSLSFRKNVQGLVAIMECILNGEEIEFRYYFDDEDHLSRAICIERVTGQTEVIFDRSQEIKSLESRIVRTRVRENSAAV